MDGTMREFIATLERDPYIRGYLEDAAEMMGPEAWQTLLQAPLTFEEVQLLGGWLDGALTDMVYRASTDEGAAIRQESKSECMRDYCAAAAKAGVSITPVQARERPAAAFRQDVSALASMFPPLPDTPSE